MNKEKIMRFLLWLVCGIVSLGFLLGATISYLDGDRLGMVLLVIGAILLCPLFNGVFAKNSILEKPVLRLVLAIGCYGILFLPMLNGVSLEDGSGQRAIPLVDNPHPKQPGYYNSPWPGEDGGYERLQVPYDAKGLNVPGLDIKEGDEVKFVRRDVGIAGMMILRDPGEVYLMIISVARGELGLPGYTYIEKVDPHTLETVKRSTTLKAGPPWPSGFAVHRNGDLYLSYGRWIHRLDADLNLLKSYKLPSNLPYNSFVILDNGYLALKEYSEEVGNLTILDPDTLTPVTDHIPLYEPSIARISGRGNTIYVVGTRSIFRYNWDEQGNQPVLDKDWIFDYIGDSTKSYGWDPVIGPHNAWFLDNGRHNMFLSMVGAAMNPAQTHLVRVSLTDPKDVTLLAPSGLPWGAVTNPPLFAADRNIVIAYDASNKVIKAYKYTHESGQLTEIWEKKDFGVSNHMIYYPATGELCTNDFKEGFGGEDNSVVLDIETGREKSRVGLSNLSSGAVFSSAGWGRDYYYVAQDTIARIYVE